MMTWSSAGIVDDGTNDNIMKLFYPGLVIGLVKDIELKFGP